MRADVDGDGAVSILDLAKVAQYFTQAVPPAPARHDQDGDNKISILDLARMAQVFTQHVSACP
jgi:Dockerin type I domain